jgi:hypothetical protein
MTVMNEKSKLVSASVVFTSAPKELITGTANARADVVYDKGMANLFGTHRSLQ